MRLDPLLGFREVAERRKESFPVPLMENKPPLNLSNGVSSQIITP